MKNMKYAVLILLAMGFTKAWAADEAGAEAADANREVASVKPASETIIDPELMNKGVWAEPSFRGPNEPARETASSESTENAIDHDKMPEQYLDVVEKIPTSDPALKRSQVEYQELHRD
jgi:hypothetical protein